MEPCKTVTLQESNSGEDGQGSKNGCQPDGEAPPLEIADNMKDLSTIIADFNSADDVRQAMKALICGSTPSNYNEDDSTIYKTQPKLTNPLNTKPIQIREADLPQRPEVPQKTAQKRLSKSKSKGGPKRKKTRQDYIDSMYTGKLSNVVHFNENKRRVYSDSESDVDSIMFDSS